MDSLFVRMCSTTMARTLCTGHPEALAPMIRHGTHSFAVCVVFTGHPSQLHTWHMVCLIWPDLKQCLPFPSHAGPTPQLLLAIAREGPSSPNSQTGHGLVLWWAKALAVSNNLAPADILSELPQAQNPNSEPQCGPQLATS